METRADLAWQPSLLGGEPPPAGEAVTFDRDFRGVTRRELAHGAWVDHVPRWVNGADELFRALLDVVRWESRVVPMYDRKVAQPRLTTRWLLEEEQPPLPVLAAMAEALSLRYGVAFTSCGCNLYRDGQDSVAWHGDRVARDLPEATIAIVSVGEPRAFRLRPKGGGTSLGYRLGHGDLLVMGGSCQRTWDHAVPKVARAGPRVSITFRHAYD